MKIRVLSLALILGILSVYVPAYAAETAGQWTATAGGYAYSLAIRADGSLWAWGDNEYGQLGDGTTEDRYSPVKIMDSVASVSAGGSHAMAVKTDGSLWAWGGNECGQLGDGTVSIYEANHNIIDDHNKYFPIKIMDSVASVSAGGSHTMAIKDDGSLWAWGNNEHGQLGDGTRIDRPSPVKIMDSVASVSAGLHHTMAVQLDGSLWALGWNGWRQLGDGTGTGRPSPVKIMDSVAYVSAGVYHTAAIQTDGSLWMWGHNGWGNIGDGTSTDRPSPVKIMDSVANVSVGTYHTAVIKTDGSLWVWGSNAFAQIDEYESTIRPSPVKIMDQAVSVSAAWAHTMAIQPDGSLWVWGWNNSGQIGNGTTENRGTPVKVMDENPSAWANEQVAAAIAAELVPYSLQSKYTQAITRTEYCALAVALYEKHMGKEITGRKTFDDTKDINVEKAAAIGIVNGVDNKVFAPDNKLTREQAAAMIARLADAMAQPLEKKGATFADNAAISSWALESVGQVQAAGIMGGVGRNTFAPQDLYTREQSILAMIRLWNIVKSQTG